MEVAGGLIWCLSLRARIRGLRKLFVRMGRGSVHVMSVRLMSGLWEGTNGRNAGRVWSDELQMVWL